MPLADTVRTATQDHDLVATRRCSFALFLVGGVQVGGVGGKLGGAGVNALVDREDVQLVAMSAQVFLSHTQQLGQALVGETFALEAEHGVAVDAGQTQGS